jgi:Mn-dependent DtxR family transcriptional regulator
MRRIAPIGKKNFVGKKFKSAKPNELNASDKNFIRNNINQFNNQQLAFRIGKPLTVVEKFIKKENLISTLEIKENEFVEVQSTKHDNTESSVDSKLGIKKTERVLKIRTFIKENYQKKSVSEIAKVLNVSVDVVRYHLNKLNLNLSKVVKTPDEVLFERSKFIRENFNKYTVSELSEKLNCSLHIVRYTLRKLKLKALRVTKSQEIPASAIFFIKANYRTMTAREMSDALGNINWSQVKYLCEKYGFLKTPEEITAIRNRWNRSEFTDSEEKYIIANHGNISLSEIANNLERTRSSVVKFLSRKGLKITKEQHDVLNRKNFEKGRLKFQEKVKAKRAIKV